MTQSRRSRAQWWRLVEGWPRSGQTQQGYCDRHGISVGSLQRWRRIFEQERDRGTAGDTTEPPPLQLVPVKLVGGTTAGEKPLTLLLPDGLRIEIPCNFDAPALTRLLGVLREAA